MFSCIRESEGNLHSNNHSQDSSFNIKKI